MRLIGNIVWLIFGGFVTACEYALAGIALCLTIVGIPFGFQCFKLAYFELMPFGLEARKVEDGNGCLYSLMNIIWFFVGAIPIVLTHLLLGLLFAITIIGLPFAKQHFKLMSLSLTPFGRDILEVDGGPFS
ncbi:YccF domain-containing protein [Chitinophagales bacterium]|jgi:uncharacterized membrane protein YccF (DUF307 family)|nr:YccF domain-containing protein [Chitinophagales bacterium]